MSLNLNLVAKEYLQPQVLSQNWLLIIVLAYQNNLKNMLQLLHGRELVVAKISKLQIKIEL